MNRREASANCLNQYLFDWRARLTILAARVMISLTFLIEARRSSGSKNFHALL